MKKTTRRDFLYSLALTGTAGFGLSELISAASTSTLKSSRIFDPIKIGIIADIHRDTAQDGDERLEMFMRKVGIEKPNLILSLGDFAHPLPKNEVFRDSFASSDCPSYHILGNHEMDYATKSEAAAFLGMPSPCYSFDCAGYHFVVLDPNFIYSDEKFFDYERRNHMKFGSRIQFIPDDQCEWLDADLKSTNSPTFILSHQSLMHDSGGIPNRAYVRDILDRENARAGFTKIIACFNGHNHMDHYRRINGIHYFSINSVSYFYGAEPSRERYPDPEVYRKHPHLELQAPYKDALYCFVTIDRSGIFDLKGVQSAWYEPAPRNPSSQSVRFGIELNPQISDHHIVLD